MDPARIPVIVGVGQINDRTLDPFAALDPVALMAEALHIADADGGGGWLTALDSLAVVDQISFRALNPVVDALVTRLGIAVNRPAILTPFGADRLSKLTP